MRAPISFLSPGIVIVVLLIGLCFIMAAERMREPVNEDGDFDSKSMRC